MLPIDMKNLSQSKALADQHSAHTQSIEHVLVKYPNVAPEPSMYCPNVLIGPFGPAPYLIILKPPRSHVRLHEYSILTSSHGSIPKMKPIIRPTATEQSVSKRAMRVNE